MSNLVRYVVNLKLFREWGTQCHSWMRHSTTSQNCEFDSQWHWNFLIDIILLLKYKLGLVMARISLTLRGHLNGYQVYTWRSAHGMLAIQYVLEISIWSVDWSICLGVNCKYHNFRLFVLQMYRYRGMCFHKL